MVFLKPAFGFLFFVLLTFVGCSRKRTTSEAKSLLIGEWDLVIGSNCASYDVASDKLILHSDGTFEQHTVSKRGFHYDAPAEKWEYTPENGVLLDSRKDFFNSQPVNEFVGVRRAEGLIVDFRSPRVILLNPNQDCFYAKPK
jgi:hypothetical protein